MVTVSALSCPSAKICLAQPTPAGEWQQIREIISLPQSEYSTCCKLGKDHVHVGTRKFGYAVTIHISPLL